MQLDCGLSAELELVVQSPDTAEAQRCGNVPVLATARIIALCEEASVAALDDQLPEDQTSVGHSVQLDHLAPVKIGNRVRAEATLAKVEGRRLTFTVSVTDDQGLIAVGKLTRVIVTTNRFLERLQ